MACSDNVVLAKLCLVSQFLSPTNVSAEAEIPARSCNKPVLITVQWNMHVCTYIDTHTHMHECVYVWQRESETVRKKSLWAFGCSSAEDKVVWCPLTWPMIHNWGRTAVAGCTDRSQGGWQMIGPSGTKLSAQMFNVHYLLTCPS